MFADASIFNQDLSKFNTSKVTNMSGMFKGATNFTGYTSQLNITNFKSKMFFSDSNFESSIGEWVTGNVTNMSKMFFSDSNFESSIGEWVTENVNNMSGMFEEASEFDANISQWKTGKVTDMSRMFLGAESLNKRISSQTSCGVPQRNIGYLDTSEVKNMKAMFKRATYFDEDLSSFDVSKLTDAEDMLTGTSISPYNFSNTLDGWSQQDVKEGVKLDAPYYSFASRESYRVLTMEKNWDIRAEFIDYNQDRMPIMKSYEFEYPPTYLNNGEQYMLSMNEFESNNFQSRSLKFDPRYEFPLMSMVGGDICGRIQLRSIGENKFFLKDNNCRIIDKIILYGKAENNSSLVLSTQNGNYPLNLLQRSEFAQIIPYGSLNAGFKNNISNGYRIFYIKGKITYIIIGFNIGSKKKNNNAF